MHRYINLATRDAHGPIQGSSTSCLCTIIGTERETQSAHEPMGTGLARGIGMPSVRGTLTHINNEVETRTSSCIYIERCDEPQCYPHPESGETAQQLEFPSIKLLSHGIHVQAYIEQRSWNTSSYQIGDKIRDVCDRPMLNLSNGDRPGTQGITSSILSQQYSLEGNSNVTIWQFNWKHSVGAPLAPGTRLISRLKVLFCTTAWHQKNEILWIRKWAFWGESFPHSVH